MLRLPRRAVARWEVGGELKSRGEGLTTCCPELPTHPGLPRASGLGWGGTRMAHGRG